MNYEDFSPEAKAGIEQFRRSLKNELFQIKNRDLLFQWIWDREMIHTACILNGADFREASKAQEFAQSKNYWLDQNA